MVNSVSSLISNKCDWNNCYIKFLELQKFGSTKKERKKRENTSEIEKMTMRCCVMPCGQTDAGSSQKHFLPFRVLVNIGIDPNFRQKGFFLALFREKFRFPEKKIFSAATLSASNCHIRSN